VEAVDILRIAKVRAAHRFGERILCLRYSDYVNVVGHETIADDVQAVFGGLLGEQLQIYMPIIIDKEYVLTIVSPLGDMMSTLGHNCPC